jgi:hypothetical protein
MKKPLVLFFILAAAVSVFAQDKPQQRTIDFTQTLAGLDSKPISNGAADKSLLTLGDVAVNALEGVLPGDDRLNGADKFKLDTLARAVFQNKAAVLTVEDIAQLKDRIGKAYGALVVGAAWRALDPAVTNAPK